MSVTKRSSLIALIASTALLVSACTNASTSSSNEAGGTTGAESTGTDSASVEVYSPAESLLPDKIRSDGVLKFAMDASYPPYEFIESGDTIVGFEADLADAVATTLGVEAELLNTRFDTIITGIKNGKFDVGMSGFAITKERAENVDFVGTISSATTLVVPKGNPNDLEMEPSKLCGYNISSQKGSSQGLELLPRLSKSCVSSDKKPIKISLFPSQNEAVTGLVSGRVDGIVAGSGPMGYLASKSEQLEVAPGQAEARATGMAVSKESKQLTEALAAAVSHLRESGAIEPIARHWGMPENSVSKYTGETFDNPGSVKNEPGK